MMIKLIMSLGIMLVGLHPIHVAVTQVDHADDEKVLQVTHKVFIDDFEKQLEERNGEKLLIGLAKEHEKCDQYIKAYLDEHFKMQVNGKPVESVWVGKEVEGAALWIYIEYPNIKKVKSIALENRILFETFKDQKNLVHFKYKDEKRSLVHQKGEPKGEVTF